MTRIAGIQFENDPHGNCRYVRIDLKKFGNEIAPFLRQVGAMEGDDFESQWANALSPDELKQQLHQSIDSWEWPDDNSVQ